MEQKKDVKNTRNHYIIKKLVAKQVTQRWTQYLVWWLEYDLKHDVWYNIRNIGAATRLIADYDQNYSKILSNVELRTTAQAWCKTGIRTAQLEEAEGALI